PSSVVASDATRHPRGAWSFPPGRSPAGPANALPSSMQERRRSSPGHGAGVGPFYATSVTATLRAVVPEITGASQRFLQERYRATRVPARGPAPREPGGRPGLTGSSARGGARLFLRQQVTEAGTAEDVAGLAAVLLDLVSQPRHVHPQEMRLVLVGR